MSNNLSKSFSLSLSFSVLWFLPPSSISSCLTPPAPPPPPPSSPTTPALISFFWFLQEVHVTAMWHRHGGEEERLHHTVIWDQAEDEHIKCRFITRIFNMHCKILQANKYLFFITVPLKRCEKPASYKKADLWPYVMNKCNCLFWLLQFITFTCLSLEDIILIRYYYILIIFEKLRRLLKTLWSKDRLLFTSWRTWGREHHRRRSLLVHNQYRMLNMCVFYEEGKHLVTLTATMW